MHLDDLQSCYHCYVVKLANFLDIMRVHQWLKNLILILPLVASGKELTIDIFLDCFLGIFGFSLVCSGNYILNDLNDVTDDKDVIFKKDRPIARGLINRKMSLLFSFSLFLFGFAICFLASKKFCVGVLIYLALALCYTYTIKRVSSLQIIILILFYQIRVFLGGLLFSISISFWLILFSFTLFSSLGFLKMFAKTVQGESGEMNSIMASKSDPVLGQAGISFAVATLITFAFYINSPEVGLIYLQPKFLWLIVPILQYLFIHLWKSTYQGEMHYDPIIFLLRDNPSRIALFGVLAVLSFGKVIG